MPPWALFTIPPFLNRIGVSPLSTRPKKKSDSRRIILDLSFPEGNSVNDGISKTHYCGEQIKLSYPSVDMLAHRIAEPGQGCLIWKKDFWRYFRQVPLCLCDYSLIGWRWKGLLYFDKMVPMGLCSAAYICQRVSDSIVFTHRQFDDWSINYLDDFGSAEQKQFAYDSYALMTNIMKAFGILESQEKVVLSTTRMDFLRNTGRYY